MPTSSSIDGDTLPKPLESVLATLAHTHPPQASSANERQNIRMFLTKETVDETRHYCRADRFQILSIKVSVRTKQVCRCSPESFLRPHLNRYQLDVP